MALTDTQLRALDYPPRPDPVAVPDAYQQWLQLVSRPATKVSSKMMGMHARHPGSALSDKYAGFHATANPPYTSVQAYWNVPYITGEHLIGKPLTKDYSCFWVGVGEFGSGTNDDMFQGGTEQDILVYYYTGYWVNIRNYYPWVEVIDKRNDANTADGRCCGQVVYNNFSINPSDQMYVGLWMGDITGASNLGLVPPLYAWWYIENITQNIYAQDFGGWWYVDKTYNVQFNKGDNNIHDPAGDGRLPSFIQFTGQSAEWEVERTETDQTTLSHLTQFVPTLMTYAYTLTSGPYMVPYQTQNPTQLTMTRDGLSGSPVLATANAVSGHQDQIQFQWYNYF